MKSLKRICMFRHSDDVHIDDYDDMDRHFWLADNVTLVTATTDNRRRGRNHRLRRAMLPPTSPKWLVGGLSNIDTRSIRKLRCSRSFFGGFLQQCVERRFLWLRGSHFGANRLQ